MSWSLEYSTVHRCEFRTTRPGLHFIVLFKQLKFYLCASSKFGEPFFGVRGNNKTTPLPRTARDCWGRKQDDSFLCQCFTMKHIILVTIHSIHIYISYYCEEIMIVGNNSTRQSLVCKESNLTFRKLVLWIILQKKQ